MNKEKAYVPPNEMPPRPIQRVLEGQKTWGTGTESGSREGGPTGFPTRSFRGDSLTYKPSGSRSMGRLKS